MADIRINALANTASSSASDDFLALDGTTNGTRKLNAYSPTFGGNATVGGTLTVSGGGSFAGSNSNYLAIASTATNQNSALRVGDGTTTWYTGILGGSEIGDGSWRVYDTATRFKVEKLTGNATVAGNLTVSGGTTTLADANGSFGTLTGSYNAGNQFVRFNRIGGTESIAMYADNSTRFINNSAEAARIFSNGNLFLGSSPTDSANGKLQLATHTTSAGGIGFGTATSLYNGAGNNGWLYVNSTGANALVGLSLSGTLKTYLYFDGTDSYLSAGSGKIIFQPNGTTALTLDSSQNATLVGDLTVSGGNVGVGGAAQSNIGLSFANMNATASSGYGGMVMGLGATLTASANADDLYGFYFNPTVATTAKTGLGYYGLRLVGPTLTGGGTITTAVGIAINSQGTSGITHAYGIDIATQSGASTTNVAIRAAGKIMFTSLPTSSVGLASGELWNDSGTVKIV